MQELTAREINGSFFYEKVMITFLYALKQYAASKGKTKSTLYKLSEEIPTAVKSFFVEAK